MNRNQGGNNTGGQRANPPRQNITQNRSQQRTASRPQGVNKSRPIASTNTSIPTNQQNRKRVTSGQPDRQTVRYQTQRPAGLKDNLRSQTPLNRKLRQQTAPSEPGTERRTSTPQYFKVKQSDKRARSSAKKGMPFSLRVTILALIAYAVILPITILLFSVMLPRAAVSDGKDVVYQLGTNKNVISRKIYSSSSIKRNGIYYVDMDSIASYCNLTVTGNSERMRYVVRESGEAVEFLIGQSIAYINGVSERTGGDAYVSSGKVYVPLEFAKRCFVGIDIALDLKNSKITIIRQTDANGEALALSFPYKLPNTMESINFGELDAEIQNDIIMQNQPTQPENPDGNTDVPQQ